MDIQYKAYCYFKLEEGGIQDSQVFTILVLKLFQDGSGSDVTMWETGNGISWPSKYNAGDQHRDWNHLQQFLLLRLQLRHTGRSGIVILQVLQLG